MPRLGTTENLLLLCTGRKYPNESPLSTAGIGTRRSVEQVLDLSDAFDVDGDAIVVVNRMENLGAVSMRLRAVAQEL